MEEATAALSLTKVDVAKSSNQLELDQVRLGTALKQSFSPMECKPEKKDAHLSMWLPPPYHQMQWLKKKKKKYQVPGSCWKIDQTKMVNYTWAWWCRSAIWWICYFRMFKTQKKLPHLINLLMLLMCFLVSFSTKTKSKSVFEGRVASSLFFLMVKVLSKESSASINKY